MHKMLRLWGRQGPNRLERGWRLNPPSIHKQTHTVYLHPRFVRSFPPPAPLLTCESSKGPDGLEGSNEASGSDTPTRSRGLCSHHRSGP